MKYIYTVSLILLNSPLYASDFEAALSKISAEQPYVPFELSLTNQDLDNLSVLNSWDLKEFNWFGDTKAESAHSQISEYLRLAGNDYEIAHGVADIIVREAQKIHDGFGSEAIRITVRATGLSSKYNLPEWHIDGLTNIKYKVVFSLKGPGTLFYPLPDNEREKFHRLYADTWKSDNLAHEANLQLRNMMIPNKIHQAKFGKGYLFISGGENTRICAVHAVPQLDEPRLFVAITPMPFKEIANYKR